MKKLIFVVDDEPHVAELLEAILVNENFNVITASSGQEALEKLNKKKPDLVILDIMMPGMTGFDVCEELRSHNNTKGYKVIFLTALKLTAIDEQYLKRLKSLDYIMKPFDNNDIVARIKKIVG